jgi:non-specific serine/threonine protein kinase
MILHALRWEGRRLITLTRTAGVGKTRLALEVAALASPAYANGVRFVPLAAVRDPAGVTPAIASALDLADAGNRSLLARVCEWLADRHALLVLDNFEQVGSAAPDVAALLSACPHLQILATSRAPLHVCGEHEYLVAPLALPSHDEAALETLADCPAVALFVARARRPARFCPDAR